MTPLVPVGATNRDQRPALPRAQKFSPTSLVERAREWFISAAAPTLPGSSQLQACGPNLSLQCLWAYWACCGPESWPMIGFLVVFRPWWPSRWHFFVLLLLYLFFFCFLLYFLILYAFSFRKIINFLLMPLVFKFENNFLVFLFSLLLYLFYFVINFTIKIVFSCFLICFLHYLFSFVFCFNF